MTVYDRRCVLTGHSLALAIASFGNRPFDSYSTILLFIAVVWERSNVGGKQSWNLWKIIGVSQFVYVTKAISCTRFLFSSPSQKLKRLGSLENSTLRYKQSLFGLFYILTAANKTTWRIISLDKGSVLASRGNASVVKITENGVSRLRTKFFNQHPTQMKHHRNSNE